MFVTSMPEASVHEDCDTCARKYDVRTSSTIRCDRWPVDEVSKPPLMECTSEPKLRAGVPSSRLLHALGGRLARRARSRSCHRTRGSSQVSDSGCSKALACP